MSDKESPEVPIYKGHMMKVTIDCKSDDFAELNALLQKFFEDKPYSCQSISFSPVV